MIILENVIYSYLKTKGYLLSVGYIGKLECDFIARKDFDDYYYIQVSKDISDKNVEDREFRPFYEIKDMYPRVLFTMDHLLQHKDGIKHYNLIDFKNNNENL